MRSLGLCAGFLLCVALLGCSGKSNPYSSSIYAVTGKVLTPGGEPVRGGAEVVLTPKAKDGGIFGKEGSGLIGADGSFSVKAGEGEAGVPGGFYLVVVRPHGAANSSEKQAAMRSIPKKYWSEDTSDLTVEVKEAKTGWEIRLAK